MELTYSQARQEDAGDVFRLCSQLIREYEDPETTDLAWVIEWVRKKLEQQIGSYTAVFADGRKAGYYHFFQNEDGEWELDDLYVLPEFQNRGIGSAVIRKCCASVDAPVVLYVFRKNERALALYKRMGFQVVKTVRDTRFLMKREGRKYYAAYDERYKTAHMQGVSWASDTSSPIVLDVIQRYGIGREHRLLEVGCGEGRDSRAVLEQGYPLLATDISEEAIAYCKMRMPGFAEHFRVLDCLKDSLDMAFDFIFGIAVIHMLVLDADRNGFYRFLYEHLKPDGIALICTMGDGEMEVQSDISQAFCIQERNHESGKMMVAGTSCRMVSFETFEKELEENRLEILEKGITSAMPDFNSLMYAVVKKEKRNLL